MSDQPAPTNDAAARAPLHPIWWLLLAAALIATGVFLFASLQRVFYPHELEWMEGAMAEHAARVADGLPLYCEPSAEHVPFLYAPLLFWLGALGITFGLDGMLALRLVAFVFTVASAALIGHWVRKDGGDRVVPGVVASGTFLAGYGWLAWWFDLARNDSLFVFLCLATTFTLLRGGRRAWLWAGLLACLALLAKQSALMWLPAMGVGALCWDWRKALRFGLVAAASMALAIGAMHVSSDGWSTFYLFEMPRYHGWNVEYKTLFWTHDMPSIAPLLLLGLVGFVHRVRSEPRQALLLAAFGCGGLIASWLSRLHAGGFDNVTMYAFAAAAVLGPLAVARLPRGPLQVTGLVLLALQFALLAWQAARRHPQISLLPSAEHRRAHDQLRTYVAAQDGPVWLPGHGYIGYRAGKGGSAHGQAIFDLLQVLPPGPLGFDLQALSRIETLTHLPERARTALRAFRDDVDDALQNRRFAAIVLDAPSELSPGTAAFEHPDLFGTALAGPDLVPGNADDPYVRSSEPDIDERDAIRPLVGYDVRRLYSWQRARR